MFGFICGIIVLIAGVAVGIWFSSYKETEEDFMYDETGRRKAISKDTYPLKRYTLVTIFGGLVLSILLVFFGCMSSVPTGNTGVITTFGRVEDRTFEAGFHLKAPWNSVVKMDNRVQKSTVELSCFSSDIQEVTMKYTLNYQIDKENAQTIYKTIGKDYYSTIIEPSIAEAVKVATARYTAEKLVQDRSELAKAIEDVLSVSLANYNIKISSTAIEDMDFTDAFTTAVEAKQVAEQKKKQAAIEYAQALEKADNEKEIALRNAEIAKTEAEAAAVQAKIKAEADAEIVQIQAEADMAVAKIGADSAEYQGRKEGSVALQRLASINGWTVVINEETCVNELYKADGAQVTASELSVGTEKLIQYYYTQTWDGKLPETYVGDDSVSSILINNK